MGKGLRNFRFEDIECLTEDKVGIWLRLSKTNQSGERQFIPFSTALAAVIENWSIKL